MPESQKARLEDVINYTPETYFTDDELALIRSTFSGSTGDRVLKIVRKALVPSISDPDLPVEEIGKDFFLSAIDFRQMQESEVKPTVLGLQLAMKVVLGGLIHLKQMAYMKEETEQERALRREKDSAA